MVEQLLFSGSPKPPNGTSVEIQTHISSPNFNDNDEFKNEFFLELFRAKFLRGLSMTRGPNDHRKDASPFRLRAVTEDDRVKMGFY